jgi:dynein heavy chain
MMYGQLLAEWARQEVRSLTQSLETMTDHLSIKVDSIENVMKVMAKLSEMRVVECEIEAMIEPLVESYTVLQRFEIYGFDAEKSNINILQDKWEALRSLTASTSSYILQTESYFRQMLIRQLEDLKAQVVVYEKSYAVEGPLSPSSAPSEAMKKLDNFMFQFESMKSNYSSLTNAQRLFGMPPIKLALFPRMEKELGVAKVLYSLYGEVQRAVTGYRRLNWALVDLAKLQKEVVKYDTRMRNLPKHRGMKDWDAYIDLKRVVGEWGSALPILMRLHSPFIKARHWRQLQAISGLQFNEDKLELGTFLEPKVLEHQDDLEELCYNAAKEADIEAKLNSVQELWMTECFQFSPYAGRDKAILDPKHITDLTSRLEDTQLVLNSLLNVRHNAFVKSEIIEWVKKLVVVNETVETWLAVQSLWIYLEAVFSGGDVAKQLPQEAKRFAAIDKTWTKAMSLASAAPNVLSVCVKEESLRTLLPGMLQSLETCQKYLTGYLETKRNVFPRFFFISDSNLLDILGQGSTPQAIQPHMRNLFDNIAEVEFAVDENNTTLVMTMFSDESERVSLGNPVPCVGPVETWLTALEHEMKSTLRALAAESNVRMPTMTTQEFIVAYPSQIVLFCDQFSWTRNGEDAIRMWQSSKGAWLQQQRRIAEMLRLLITMLDKDDMSVPHRINLETLITINVHQREVYDRIMKLKVKSIGDFEWLKQLRHYWKYDEKNIVISITDIDFSYGYEFLGSRQRLVVTPLTDRCYITLAQALGLFFGGAPIGPAGTGKTETVKDMGRTLGKYVVVFNCSDQMDYVQLGKIFKGLAQSGAWGDFDEFNRINLDVLSVVAQQIACILNGLKNFGTSTVFTDGVTINLDPTCGFFITMNPTYAGRTELPENLKSLFRCVSMMVPDRKMIIQVRLAANGFQKSVALAKKFSLLYHLCESQLSKQRHYDFGLRNILSVLRSVGTTKRRFSNNSEQEVLIRVLLDMNLSKLTPDDEALFLATIEDIFPNYRVAPEGRTTDMLRSMKSYAEKEGLVANEAWIRKVSELYQNVQVRHGIMILGPSCAGKSQCLQALTAVQSEISGRKTVLKRMNPKAITDAQMFGRLNESTQDWTEGIFSQLWRRACDVRPSTSEISWIVLDGPVDTLWIENLNSVLDDSKILTLANGDRISMAPETRLIFETENLDNAAYSTVTRTGMVYLAGNCLGWQPVLESWLTKVSVASTCDMSAKSETYGRRIKQTSNNVFPSKPLRLLPDEIALIRSLFTAHGEAIFAWARDPDHSAYQLQDVNKLETCLSLFESLLVQSGAEPTPAGRTPADVLERKWLFAVVWSVGATIKGSVRRKFHDLLGRMGLRMPDPRCVQAGVLDGTRRISRRVSNIDAAHGAPANPPQKKPLPAAAAPPPAPPSRAEDYDSSAALLGDGRSSVFDYYLDENCEWVPWTALVMEWPFLTAIKNFRRRNDSYDDDDDEWVRSLPLPPEFSSIFIPTVDSVQLEMVADLIVQQRKPLLVIGEAGSAKTVTISRYLESLTSDLNDPEKEMLLSFKTMTLSSASTHNIVQTMLENLLSRRAGLISTPTDGGRLIVFLDDLSLPQVNEWGDQPTNELVRQAIELSQFYSLKRPGECIEMDDVQFIAAMMSPSGGRNDIPRRLRGRFNVMYLPPPSKSTLERIYGSIASGLISEARGFSPHLAQVVGLLPSLTYTVWHQVKSMMLPTPNKAHYIFSMRDLSRIFEVIVATDPTYAQSEIQLLNLWKHECQRVLSDKFISERERLWLDDVMLKEVKNVLIRPDTNFWLELSSTRLFCDFWHLSVAPQTNEDGEVVNSNSSSSNNNNSNANFSLHSITASLSGRHGKKKNLLLLPYTPIPSVNETRPVLEAFIERFNTLPRVARMDLVLFQDAICHIMRICRVLRMQRGSILLVGLEGSGRKTLARLSAYICGLDFATYTSTSSVMADLTEFLKKVCVNAGAKNIPTALLVVDSAIKHETYLEYINVLLTSGEVSSFFSRDELRNVLNEVRSNSTSQELADSAHGQPRVPRHRPAAAAPPHGRESVASSRDSTATATAVPMGAADVGSGGEIGQSDASVYGLFINKVRANLHIILCFSPVSSLFHRRILNFPGLVSCCAINWFNKWPPEALFAVSSKFLKDTPDLRGESQKIAAAMALVHESVETAAADYLESSWRRVYVTPKLYLNYIENFHSLHSTMLAELSVNNKRLTLGLQKLSEGEVQVELMGVELAAKRQVLATKKESLSVLMEDMKVNKTHALAVSEKVKAARNKQAEDTRIVEQKATEASDDLKAAIPYLEAAKKALASIHQKDINILKALKTPHNLIQRVFDAVLILLRMPMARVEQDRKYEGRKAEDFKRHAPSWGSASALLKDPRLIDSLMNYPKTELDDETIELLEPYLGQLDFTEKGATKVSSWVAGLCIWVRAMVTFWDIYKVVKPKQELLDLLTAEVAAAAAKLAKMQADLDEKQRILDAIVRKYDESLAEKVRLESDLEQTIKKMAAARQLVQGLQSEKIRWTAQLKGLEEQNACVCGNVVMAAAALVYLGPFNQPYRQRLHKEWLEIFAKINVPIQNGISLRSHFASDNQVNSWSLEGLPLDEHSVQNGIVVLNSKRVSLLIDPQSQAVYWIHKREAANRLQIATPSTPPRELQGMLMKAVSEGTPFLMKDMSEVIPSVFANLVDSNVTIIGRGVCVVAIGDSEVEWHPSFKLYMATKLPNPNLSPETFSQIAVVDFTVTLQGLQAQLLGRVVQREKAELEAQRRQLLRNTGEFRMQMAALEDDLLARLSNVEGTLLDDMSVIDVLSRTKRMVEELSDKLRMAHETNRNIEAARNEYYRIAERGSVLYFLMVDLSKLNHMYQFSLHHFERAFDAGLEMASESLADTVYERVAQATHNVSYALYKSVVRGLYKRDTMTFQLLMAVRVDMQRGTVDPAYLDILLLSGASKTLPADATEIATRLARTAKWLSSEAAMNLIACSKHPNLSQVVFHLERNQAVWQEWFNREDAEARPLPFPLLNKATAPFEHLLVVRALRPDRCMLAASLYISLSIGQDFVSPPRIDYENILAESSATCPIVLLLSPGADPSKTILETAQSKNIPVQVISMGQGQELRARQMVMALLAEEGATQGWLLMQNCHLSTNFMAELQMILADAVVTEENKNARIWLTSQPVPDFPIVLLQSSIKCASEPPHGLRFGLARVFDSFTKNMLESIEREEWQPLVFSISFMHCAMIERVKYGPLGWNVPYEFNVADLNASVEFVRKYLYQEEAKKPIKWETIRYMVCEVMYGGRITDDFDRMLLLSFGNSWIGPDILDDKFSFAPGYVVPRCQRLEEYQQFIAQLPLVDAPDVLGLHHNAEVIYRTDESKMILRSIGHVQPKGARGGGPEVREQLVLRRIEEIMSTLPKEFDLQAVARQLQRLAGSHAYRDRDQQAKASGPVLHPLLVFLKQEVAIFQKILVEVRCTLGVLELAINGAATMYEALQSVSDCLYRDSVPPAWMQISWEGQSSLASWLRLILAAVAQLSSWLHDGQPRFFNMACFTNPHGFLTAVKQSIARSNKQWNLDDIEIYASVLRSNQLDLIRATGSGTSEDGVYISGLCLEGASWDPRMGKLLDASNQQLYCALPPCLVTARSVLSQSSFGFNCPVYRFPIR